MNTQFSPATTNTAVNFLTPTNLQEAMQIAEILASSDIVPKDYQRKPGNILVAMQWGAEIGLQPLQAMQNIAVINGRPSIWGDAMLALVRGSGLLDLIKEEITEDGLKAICTVKRKGEEPAVSEFSMEDAKRAGLAGKQGPWTQYPKRMMKLRARSYALRDVFPDVLKGMAIAEEEQDKEIDVTPENGNGESKPNSGASALKSRLKKKTEAVDSVAKEITFDVSACLKSIENAQSLEQLKEIASGIPSDLGEPDISTINQVYKSKKSELGAQTPNLISLINATTELKALEQLKSSIDAAKTTKAEKQLLLDTYRDRHFTLSQVDIFAEQSEKSSFVDLIIERIENATSQDEINAVFMDPALEELSDADRQLVNDAAAQREAEITG